MPTEELSYLVALVLIGYWFSSRLNERKLKFRTLSNYAVFCESAISGVVLFVVSFLLVSAYKHYVHECNFWELMAFETCSDQEANYPIWQPFTFVVAIVLATILPYVVNIIWQLNEVLEKAARANGQIPNMILDTLKETSPIEISTVGRKLYIGFVRSASGISLSGEMVDVSILPMYSGYRTGNRLDRVITTRYTPIYREA